jgi:hypothetical protein
MVADGFSILGTVLKQDLLLRSLNLRKSLKHRFEAGPFTAITKPPQEPKALSRFTASTFMVCGGERGRWLLTGFDELVQWQAGREERGRWLLMGFQS